MNNKLYVTMLYLFSLSKTSYLMYIFMFSQGAISWSLPESEAKALFTNDQNVNEMG